MDVDNTTGSYTVWKRNIKFPTAQNEALSSAVQIGARSLYDVVFSMHPVAFHYVVDPIRNQFVSSSP